jgi:hypothetical protein
VKDETEILHYVINEKLPKFFGGKLDINPYPVNVENRVSSMYGIQTSIYRYMIFTAAYCWNPVHLPKIAV